MVRMQRRWIQRGGGAEVGLRSCELMSGEEQLNVSRPKRWGSTWRITLWFAQYGVTKVRKARSVTARLLACHRRNRSSCTLKEKLPLPTVSHQRRTKMLSFTRNNGQYQQDGQLAQSSPAASQFNLGPVGNRETVNANRSMYKTAGAKPQHISQLTYHYGADSKRLPSYWQTSAVPHQAVYFQQTAVSDNYQQRSPTNDQSGNPQLHVITGQNSLIQSSPNVMLPKMVYPQQVNSPNWNQSVGVYGKPSITTQNGNIVSNRNHCWDNSFFLNPNENSVVAVFTTATSPQHGALAYNGTLGPAAAHHGPTAHNNSPGQNYTQHCSDPPSCMSVCQSFRNDDNTTPSSSSGQNFQVSTASPFFQQSSTRNNGGETTGCINSNNRQHETDFSGSKPNNFPVNTDAQQERLRQQSISRIKDYLRTPIVPGSDGRPQVNTNSAFRKKKNVTSTVAKIFNANASQAIRQNSRHPLPQTTSVMSAQHCVDVRDVRQSFVPNVNVSATQDGNHYEMLSAKANDRSSLLSPGRTRVVAVVQPLSQGSYQVASQQRSSNTEAAAADGSLSCLERLLISLPVISLQNKQSGCLKVGQSLLPENPTQVTSSHYGIPDSSVSNNGIIGLSSASSQHLQQNQSTVAGGSNLDVDKCVAPTAQQSVTSKVTVKNYDMDLSDTPNKKTNGVVELSSVPKAPWTTDTLSKYIHDYEEAQMKLKDLTTCSPLDKLLSMFWDGDISNLVCALRKGMYQTVMNDVKKACHKHATLESLSQVWISCTAVTELNNYQVLKDTDVFKELPYKSLWLNVNEQLDDIDKEFDFPQSLKYHLHTVKSVSQPVVVEKECNISAQTVNEVSNKMLSSTERQLVELNEEKQDPGVETTSTETAAPIQMKATDSSDRYSFQIQVLTPEDAKVLFQQVIKNPPESMDIDYQPGRVLNSSGEVELPDIDLTQSDPKLEDKTFCPIEEICCIERWMENISGSNTASLSKCKCQLEQSRKELPAKTNDKEEIAAQENDAFKPANKSPPAAVSRESVNNQVLTFDWPVIVDVFSENLGIPEDHEKSHSHSDQDPESIYHISIDSGQSSIILVSDDEELSCIESETLNQMPNFESNSEQAQVELTKSGQSNCSDGKKNTNILEIHSDPEVEFLPCQLKSTGNLQSLVKRKIKNLSGGESEAAIEMTDLKENCGQAQAPSTNETESSLETKEKQSAVVPQKPWSGKLKRTRGPDRFLPASKKCKSLVDVNSQPIHEDASKCGKGFFQASDGEPSPLSRPTVDLVLFGSRTQDNCVVIDGRKNRNSFPDAGPKPPKSLTVNLSPLKKKTFKTVQTWECSVKRLFKKWKLSFQPAKIKHKLKLKAQKGTFASSSKWNLDTTGPADAEQLPVFSKKRLLRGQTKPCMNLRLRNSLSEKLQCDEKTQTLNHTDDQERRSCKGGSNGAVPLQSNSTLKYSVLPVSFNFGSNGIQETKDPVPAKPDVVKGKEHTTNETAIERSTWYPMPPKNHLLFPPTPNTRSLFQAYQKKYMEKVKPLGDK